MIYLTIITLLISIGNVHAVVPVGVNSNEVYIADLSQAYVNLLKQSSPWGNVSNPWQTTTMVDPKTGWPIGDFSVVILVDGLDLGGAYFLSGKGDANVSVFGNSDAYITNKSHDKTTDIMTAIVNIPENSTTLILSFANTTGPGLTDVTLLAPSYNLTSKTKISDLVLAHLSRFDMIRFNPWTLSNSGFDANWTTRTPLDWPQYMTPNHNPWETIPYIVNQLNKSVDVWLNIPWNATDDYIINLAKLMLENLNIKTNNIYLEYVNELWNYINPQAKANLAAANDSVVNQGDPYHFNYDNCSKPSIWAWRRSAYEIKRIGELFKSVFGEENVGQWKRVRPLLAGQTSYASVILNSLDYLNTIFGPPSNYLHGITIAPYFDIGENRTWSNLTVDQVLDGLNSSLQQFQPEYGWNYKATLGVHGIYAAWHNLTVYGYEGGVDTAAGCGPCSLEAKINATRHPRMADICVDFLNGWYRFGFQTLNWFLAGAREINHFGSWALLEDMRQETLIDTTHMFNSTSYVAQLPRPAPKLKAIDQVRQSTVEFNFGIPVPSLKFNATHYMNHYVPDPRPDLRYLQPNSTFYYPIQIRQVPIQINITVYVAGKSGLLEGGINNQQFVQVQTPQTANMTTFEAAPTMLFNISQIPIPSIVAFRIRNIQSGYSISSFDVVVPNN
jgi:hypothetical protein